VLAPLGIVERVREIYSLERVVNVSFLEKLSRIEPLVSSDLLSAFACNGDSCWVSFALTSFRLSR